MKIQLDQNGNSKDSLATLSRARGILLTRKGKRLVVDIGTRVTPQALFAALSHIRSISYSIYFTSKKTTIDELIPLNSKLSASDACFHLSKLLIQQVENRQTIFHTKELGILTSEHMAQLPISLHHLCDLRVHRLDTATALLLLDEMMMAQISFVLPSSEMAYIDCGHRVHKLPQNMRWPADEPYVPLAFSQL